MRRVIIEESCSFEQLEALMNAPLPDLSTHRLRVVSLGRVKMNLPQDTIETPFGKMGLTVISADEIKLFTDEEMGGCGPITVNRVEYKGSIHFNRNDGSWGPLHYRSIFMHRVDWLDRSFNDGDMTWKARDKVEEVLVPLVAAWAERHTDDFKRAEDEQTHRRIERIEAEIERLEDEIAKKRAEIAELERSVA